jgi:hypothetical protein
MAKLAETPSDLSFYSKVIATVKSFHGVSALVVLVIGTAFSIHEVRSPSTPTFYALLLSVLIIAALDLTYVLMSGSSDVTFRVRTIRAESGATVPLAGLDITLYKNGKKVRSRLTSEEGEAAFRESVGGSDELYVQVTDSQGAVLKAALYSEGQLQVVRSIRIR